MATTEERTVTKDNLGGSFRLDLDVSKIETTQGVKAFRLNKNHKNLVEIIKQDGTGAKVDLNQAQAVKAIDGYLITTQPDSRHPNDPYDIRIDTAQDEKNYNLLTYLSGTITLIAKETQTGVALASSVCYSTNYTPFVVKFNFTNESGSNNYVVAKITISGSELLLTVVKNPNRLLLKELYITGNGL